MKKVFLSLLCFLSMFAYAQNDNSFHVSGNYNKKGELPPAWLKNKVSAAQYDPLGYHHREFVDKMFVLSL